MKSKKYFVLLNPIAGKGRFQKHLEGIKSEFLKRNISYELVFTDEAIRGDTLLNQHLDSSYSDLLVIGGDGTINEAINGLKYDIPISVISMGTGNDSIKNIHKDHSFKNQMHMAFEGVYKKIDLGICNGRKFLNGVGIGFDGKVVEIMESEGKRFTGHMAYFYTVLKILATYKEKETVFRTDKKTHSEPVFLLTIAKGTTFGGGFMLNPFADHTDGMLDICQVGKIPVWLRAYYVPQLKNGNHRKLAMVKFYKSKNVIIEENSSIVGHMDGEFIGSPPFDIKVLPKALTFRV